ncbi:hypothetical protein D7X30_19035 [Corallococcus sp. AB011P]|nr:hypothetical protein D7X30_19035 [Corallococcus sp. AB011P]
MASQPARESRTPVQPSRLPWKLTSPTALFTLLLGAFMLFLSLNAALTVMLGGASLAFALAVHGSAAVYGVVLAAALLRPQKVIS